MTTHRAFEPVSPEGFDLVPARKRAGDAGYDLHTTVRTVLRHGGMAVCPTGVRFNVPPGFVGLIQERSGHGLRGIFTLGNVIDSGYRGEVRVILANVGGEDVVFEAGDRVGQVLLVPCLMLGPEGPARGAAGYGSTGAGA